jgi:hypothetical protein
MNLCLLLSAAAIADLSLFQGTRVTSRTSGAPSVPSPKRNTRCTSLALAQFTFDLSLSPQAPPLQLLHAWSLSMMRALLQEQVLAVGRGFDWLHLPNKALIVGPYRFVDFKHCCKAFRMTRFISYNLGDPIATAGSLLLSNLKDGRIPKSAHHPPPRIPSPSATCDPSSQS